MRLPRLRLRLPGLRLEWLDRFSGLVNRTVLLYAAFTTVLFVVFLIVNFPHDVVVRRVMGELDLTPFELSFKSARFAWHRGYELTSLRLSQASADGELPLIELSTFDIRPELMPLLRGRFNDLHWHGELYGGQVEGTWTMTRGGGTGRIELGRVDLGRYRTLTVYLEEGQLSGQLSGAFTVQLAGFDAKTAQVAGDVSVVRPGLAGAKIQGFTVPDLQFAEVKGKISMKGGRVDLQEVRATGDQLNVQLSGNITLRQPIEASQLNLRATLEQSAATPDAIKTLIALIPRPRNARPDAPITISGTLAAPRVR